MCIYAHPFSIRVYCVVKGEVISISAWALDIARSTTMGIPEPLRVGRVTTVSRFFCVVTQDFRAQGVMDTLMNVASIPEESESRLPSEGLPPVTAAGSQRCGTGVSLEYVLHPTHGLPKECRWYVLRATYGREREAEDLLKKRGVLVYVPKRKTLKMVKGEKKKVEESLLPNLVFVFTDECTARRLVAFPLKSESRRKDKMPVSLHFMYDHTSLNENGLNDVVVIPHKEMVNFIRFTIGGSESIRAVSPADFRIKKDQQVVITEGDFKGVVGRVARIDRQTCVIVDLQPICFLASAYIPKAFLREVPEPENI